MTLPEALERLDALLGEERLAIRSIDADRVAALADEKLDLMEVLRVADWQADGRSRERLRRLVPRLRENGVLLSYARNTSRDLLRAMSASLGTTYDSAGSATSAQPSRRLSINV